MLAEPDAEAPMLIAVVEPDTPAVPMLRVLDSALSVAPPPMPIVMLFVDGASVTAPVCDGPPKDNVPEVWLVPIAMLSVSVVKLTAPDTSSVVILMPDCHDGAALVPPDVSN